jgi:phospholipid/cholesterol/gamma-HCH transport system permease protein
MVPPVIVALVERFRSLLEVVQDFTLFTFETIRSCFRRPFYAQETFHQLHFALIGSLAIVLVSALVAGQALAIQLARELTNTGTKGELGHMMVISVVRALGPVLTGMVVASRMSAGITAELGAMRSSDQIDALVAFGTDPIRRLVVPRNVALVIALPVLTILGDALAILGGAFVGLQYHLTWAAYWNGVMKYLTHKNLLVGMMKPFFFAILIVTTACWKGFRSEGGAKGVGVATTESVVIASVGILVTDVITTRLLFRALGW